MSIVMAKEIMSADNELEEDMNGAILFKNRKAPHKTENDSVDKGALQCALTLADMLNHKFIVKYADKVKDHWYGSYPDVQTAIDQALSKPDSKYFEILPSKLPRYFYIDLEYLQKTLLGVNDTFNKVSKKTVLNKVIQYVCDYAEELSGRPVSRKTTVAMSLGQANCNTWRGLQKISYHIKFDFAFPDQMSINEFIKTLVIRIMQTKEPLLRYIKKDKKGEDVVKSVIDNAPYQKNQSWRCLNSIKPEDTDPMRRLIPDKSSSIHIADHLVGIYDEETLASADVLNLDLGSRSRRPVRKPLQAKCPETSSSEMHAEDPVEPEYKVPADLLRSTVENYSIDRADNYFDWMQTLWGVYNVTYELDMLDIGHEIVHSFSQKSTKYDQREVDVIWNTTKYVPTGWKWPSLRGWLWQDAPAVWKKFRSDIFTSDLMARDNKEVYRESYVPHPERYTAVLRELESYNSPKMKPIQFGKANGLIYNGAMGTGKGLAIEDLVLSGKFKSVVVVVNRITLCSSTIRRLNKKIREHYKDFVPEMMFRDYRRPNEVFDPNSPHEQIPLTEKGPATLDLEEFPFLVIQMESIHKIKDNPDLLIMDECESDLAQFYSPTMTRMKDCSKTLRRLVRFSEKTVFLDAFMSDKTLGFVHNILKDSGKTILYQENTWKPKGRHAYELRSKEKTTDGIKSITTRAVLAKIGLGKKVVLFSSNNTYAVSLFQIIREQFPDKVAYIYNSDTDDNIKRSDLEDVDAVWCDADVVIYSPTILTGVSFNIMNHFDCVFIFGYSKSCCIRDMWQASGRVRYPTDQELYYSLDTFGDRRWDLPLTYSGVNASVLRDGELNRKYSDEKEMCPSDIVPAGDEVYSVLASIDKSQIREDRNVQEELFRCLERMHMGCSAQQHTPAWLLEVYVRNRWEQYLTHSPSSFRTVFHEFMQLAGWEQAGKLTTCDIINWENCVRRLVGEEPVRVPKPDKAERAERDYDEIISIDTHTAQFIEERRNRGTASNQEKLQLQKYWFDHVVTVNNTAPRDVRAKVFNAISESPHMKLLLSIWSEYNEDPETALHKLLTLNPYADIQGASVTVLVGVKKICRLLGLLSTHDTETIVSETTLQENQKELQEVVNDMQETLKLKTSSSKSDNAVKVLKLNIDTILQDFAATKLKGKATWSGHKIRKYQYTIRVLNPLLLDIVMCVCPN